MITKNDFIKLVTTNVDGTTRTELAAQPHAVGDVLTLTKYDEAEVNGNKFVALYTDDDRMLSANSVLRRGNGINFGTKDLKEAAGKLESAVQKGLTLTIAKVYKSESGAGFVRNNYRFNPVVL